MIEAVSSSRQCYSVLLKVSKGKFELTMSVRRFYSWVIHKHFIT